MKDHREILKKSVLFRGLTDTEAEALMDRLDGKMKQLQSGESYSTPGERLTTIGIVIRGEMQVTKVLESGMENLIQKLHRGYLVGADIVYTTSQVNPYYIYASENTELWCFSVTRFTEEEIAPIAVRKKIQTNLLQFLANENIRKQFKIDVLSRNSLRERILSYLYTRANKLGTSEFTIPFDREEMANYLCVNRSALSHELSLMRQEGIIDFKKNYFRINHVDNKDSMV